MTEPDVLVRIRQVLPSLSTTEARVANITLDDPISVAQTTIAQLAALSGASPASIIRFYRTLGYDGYAEFRIAVAQAISRHERDLERSGLSTDDINPDDSVGDVVLRVAFREARAIEATAHTISLDALEQAVAKLNKAEKVMVTGFGASALTAQDLSLKLDRIGMNCVSPVDFHIQLSSVALLTEKTAIVLISHQGSTTEIIELARLAKATHATVIAITNVPGSPLGAIADIVLTTATTESAFRTGAMSSRIAQLAVVDFLFVRLVQARFVQAKSALDLTRQTLAAHR